MERYSVGSDHIEARQNISPVNYDYIRSLFPANSSRPHWSATSLARKYCPSLWDDDWSPSKDDSPGSYWGGSSHVLGPPKDQPSGILSDTLDLWKKW